MGRSRPMREANYRSNSYSKNKVKCEEVTARMINIGSFHCVDCGVRLIYARGTRPYFRLSKNKSHDEKCDYYLPIDDISERIKEIGERLQVKLAPPHFHKEVITKENCLKDKIMEISSEKKTVKLGPIKTIKNPHKTTNYTFSSVERLFFAISNERPEKTRKIMLSKLLSNKQLYFANRYKDLIKDYEDDKLNNFFFVMGYLHQKEYFSFKENGYIDIQDARYNYGSIELRVHIKGISALEKRFKNISWYIKSGPNKTAYTGVMGKIIGIETIDNKIYLNIKCYDLDIEYLQNHE